MSTTTIPPEARQRVPLVTRMTPTARRRVRALATAEGLTVQQLGVYAWSLALQAYGKSPLTEADH